MKYQLEKLQIAFTQMNIQIGDLTKRMDERFEKMDERFEKMDERFEKMDERFGRLEDLVESFARATAERFDQVETHLRLHYEKFENIESHLKSHDAKFDDLTHEVYANGDHVARMSQKMDSEFAAATIQRHRLDDRISRLEKSHNFV